MNKRVSCRTCNSVKRGWDRKYKCDDAVPTAPTPADVERALESARKYILDKYAAGWDADFEPMMKEIKDN